MALNLPAAGPHCLATSQNRARSLYDRLVALWEPEQAVLCVGGINWKDGKRVPQDAQPLALLAKSAVTAGRQRR